MNLSDAVKNRSVYVDNNIRGDRPSFSARNHGYQKQASQAPRYRYMLRSKENESEKSVRTDFLYH
jgi:hypothetical protein